jgi:hypothetical protein
MGRCAAVGGYGNGNGYGGSGDVTFGDDRFGNPELGDSGLEGDAPAGAGFPSDACGPGSRDQRLGLFAQGQWGDVARPSGWLALQAGDVTRPQVLGDATDDEALGILRTWKSLGAWADAGKLTVARELIRRHPVPGSEGAPGGLPWEWDPRLGHEVSAALGISPVGANRLLAMAWALEARLPGIGQALDGGRLDYPKARLIVEETDVLLEPGKLAVAQELILAGLADCRTWADLVRLVQRAVVTADPDGAEKRRKAAEREQARVRFWRESSGTCALQGTGLPTDQALAANASIEARALEYKAVPVSRPMDILRVMAYLDLINGVTVAQRVAWVQAEDAECAAERAEQAAQAERDARIRDEARDEIARRKKARATQADGRRPQGSAPDGAPDGSAPDGAPESAPDDSAPDGGVAGEPGDGYPEDWPAGDPAGSSDGCGGRGGDGSHGDGEPDDGGEPDSSDGGDAGSGPAGGGPRGGGPRGGCPGRDPGGGALAGHGACPACGGPGISPVFGLPVRGNLTLPLQTLQGLAERPGEAHGLGALDPALVRDLARAGASHPGSEFCVTIVDNHGHAVGHGCCTPVKAAKRHGKGGKSGKSPPGPAPPGPVPPGDAARDRATFTPSGRAGPDGGYGSWILTLPGAPHPYRVDIDPVPVYDCDHRHETTAYQPSRKLRHLVQIRDGACSYPTCSRHARESDLEHAVPYAKGGRTCACNAHACSRSCHQVKQSPGWSFANIRPGFHQWTTGAGRVYLQGPWQYPC